MTTVAYKNGVMASDGRMTSGSRILYEDYSKIRIIQGVDTDYLIGFAGTVSQVDLLLEWASTDFDIDLKPKRELEASAIDDIEAIVIRKSDDKVSYYDGYGFIELGDREVAIGSGADAAQAAMILGCGPKEAVELASRLDVYTNNTVFVMTRDIAFE